MNAGETKNFEQDYRDVMDEIHKISTKFGFLPDTVIFEEIDKRLVLLDGTYDMIAKALSSLLEKPQGDRIAAVILEAVIRQMDETLAMEHKR
jgi:hypothetical protein